MPLGYLISDVSFLQLSFNLLECLITFHINFDSRLLNDFNRVLFHIYRVYGPQGLNSLKATSITVSLSLVILTREASSKIRESGIVSFPAIRL